MHVTINLACVRTYFNPESNNLAQTQTSFFRQKQVTLVRI